MDTVKAQTIWPALPYEKWKDTLDTLHMSMQIAGKVKLALHPFINHWWEVAFQINSSGMTTGLIPHKDDAFDINFDFLRHEVLIHKTSDESRKISLYPRSVKSFYAEFMAALADLGIYVTINPMAVEVPDPVSCDIDELHSSYDSRYVLNWWQLQVKCHLLFERFRSTFRGKSSPVQFFWGSFDLNGTRFSGKPATPPDYGGRIMRFAENEENFSFGFWPGDKRFPHPAFYAYLYPAPKGIENARIEPLAASFSPLLGEFILPYEKIYESPSAGDMILQFLKSTYNESARLAGWDLRSLEGPVPF
ncbi:MAG: hypothetical protein HF314_08190 [Ignavibacteria bacterium]|jgi:hypothetical protein|nr:hypothetical protein [Ignavibacteria bacterium]MCU7503038.1 hypothetical protein [Ignavibacteria bacterium]MCU7516542.1 hypothetical protein [Ignavibacteria bacterium]